MFEHHPHTLNFISMATSIAELVHGEKSRTQSVSIHCLCYCATFALSFVFINKEILISNHSLNHLFNHPANLMPRENIHTNLQSRCWENCKCLWAIFCRNLVMHQSNIWVQCQQLVVVERICLSASPPTSAAMLVTLINHCTCWQRHSYGTCAVAEAAVTDSIWQLWISCHPSQLPKVARATSLLVLIRRFQMSGNSEHILQIRHCTVQPKQLWLSSLLLL